jgi:hypothetical protein
MGDSTTTTQQGTTTNFATVPYSSSRFPATGYSSYFSPFLSDASQLYNQGQPTGSEPWTSTASPLINQALGQNVGLAGDIYNTGYLTQPFYTGSENVTDPYGSAYFQQSIAPLLGAAQGGNLGAQFNPLYSAIEQQGQSTIPGMDWGMAELYKIAGNPEGIQTSPYYQQMFEDAAKYNPLSTNFSGELTPTQQAILSDNAQRLAMQQASLSSGSGRYGSFGMNEAMARTIAETNNPLIAQFNQAGIQNALTAAGQQYQQQAGAAQGLTGVQQQNLANQMAASQAGAGLGLNQQQLALQTALNATGGLANLYGQDVAQQIQAAQAAMGGTLGADQQALGWAGALPNLYQGAMAPGMTEAQAGEYFMNYPWANMRNYLGALSGTTPLLTDVAGLQPMTSNVGTTTTQSEGTPWTQFAGLGIGGLSLFGAPAGGTSAISGLSSALGGLSFLSDERLKTDIEPVGDWRGLPIYSFRYKGDPKSYPKVVGPMAQDVQKVAPEMVGQVGGKDGPLYIKGPWTNMRMT